MSSIPARSTLPRGMAALVIAPLLVTIPAGVMLMTIAGTVPHWSDVGPSALHSGLGLAWTLLRCAFLFGLPVWLLLRGLRRESAWTYTLAGAAEALGAGIWLSYAFTGGIRPDQIGMILVATATGALIALQFWTIARERPQPQ